MIFTIFIAFLILQRLSELYISRRNERWLLLHGGVQYGQRHYPYMIALHTLFIIALIAEFILREQPPLNPVFLLLFLIGVTFKYWVIGALGRCWTTKIYRIPGTKPVKKGPYRFFKHPNYAEVVFEIAVIPLIFHLYVTTIVFSVLNGWMLWVRIKIENEVWADS